MDILRAFDAAVTEDRPKERTIVATINTGDIDRFNSVIDPAGARLDGYNRSGKAVLWNHGQDPRRRDDPIGQNLWIKPDGGPNPTKLIAKTRFLDDEFSDQRYQWYRSGVLNGFSIRPLPDWTRCGPATKDEIKANPALGQGYYREGERGFPGVMMFRSWELAEYSAVALVGNANCVTLERALRLLDAAEHGLGLADDDLAILRGLAAAVSAPPAAPPEPEPDPIARTVPYVAEHGGHWYVMSRDGIAIARYDAEPPALRCLAVLAGAPGPRYAERVQTDVMAVRAWCDKEIARAVEELDLKLNGRLGSR